MKSNKKQRLKTKNTNNTNSYRKKIPSGVFYIVAARFMERFSIAGIASIIMVYAGNYLFFGGQGSQEFVSSQTIILFHIFFATVTAFSLIGGLIADIFLGKYKTVAIFSIIYCLGYLVLTLVTDKTYLVCGLALVAVGCGGSLPCLISHLGDQFNNSNKKYIDESYNWFYLAVSVGTFLALFLMPYLFQKYGAQIAFGINGIAIFIALIIFCCGKKAYIIIPPVGWHKYIAELKDKQNLKAVGNLVVVFIFTVFFSALRDQSNSSLVIQASKMNPEINFGFVKFMLASSQIQSFEYIFCLLFIPLFIYVIYPFLGKYFQVTHLKRIAVGFFVTTITYALLAYIQTLIEKGGNVGIIWQIFAYALISIQDILVLITCTELAYVHSPRFMKSSTLAFVFMSISLGDQMVIILSKHIYDHHGHLIVNMSAYFALLAAGMFIVWVLFIIYIPYYKGKLFLQLSNSGLFLQLSTINDLLKIILDAAKRRIIMISVSGSFSKENLQEDIYKIRSMKYDHNTTYHFTIITKERSSEGLNEISIVKEFVAKEFAKHGLYSITSSSNPHNNISFSYKSIYTLKSEISYDPKMSDFTKELIPIYISSNFKLSELIESAADRIKLITEVGYRHFYTNAISFLNFTRYSKEPESNISLLAFQLHQAAESFYNSALLSLSCYRPKTHKIKDLNNIVCNKTNCFDNVFPVSTREEQECFSLLEKAYFARYSASYKITRGQLDYLISRVELLQQITLQVYKQEVEALQNKVVGGLTN